MPTACQRVTRSRSTRIANNTVAAGYSEISTPASDSIDALHGEQSRDVGDGVEHAAEHREPQRGAPFAVSGWR